MLSTIPQLLAYKQDTEGWISSGVYAAENHKLPASDVLMSTLQ